MRLHCVFFRLVARSKSLCATYFLSPSACCALIVVCFGACSLPQWRVFQKKVEGKAAEKPGAQIEGEKRAAAFIRNLTAPPVANPAAAVADVHAVAVDLSASLGEPERLAKAEDKDAVIADLRSGLRAKERQLDQWKAFGRKYAGVALEDTGFNMAGPAGFAALIGIAVLCVACPTLPWLLLRVVPRLYGALRSTAVGIEAAVKRHPAATAPVLASLSRKQDRSHKELLKRVRSGIKAHELDHPVESAIPS
jgi:hypothetical protein